MLPNRRKVIRPNTMLFAEPGDCPGSITIENDVMIGAGVHIYVVKHRYDMSNINIINALNIDNNNKVMSEENAFFII